ncbi:MAG TPA: 50S ribosomal protein L25 [Actinomycetota bacterium]|nr:50S ribosomal protein L25 [Actinomycetota bacterium]
MKAIELTVAPRDGSGKGAARKLRTTGQLPGVLYGPGIETQSLAVPRHEFVRLLKHHGSHALVALKVDGGNEYLAIVKDVQVDPVRWEALHVDFVRVQEDKPVTTEVQVVLVGEPAGVKMGGVLDQLTRSVTIEALPRSIPSEIEYDVSELGLGDVIRVGDLQAPQGVTIATDPEETLASVAQPRVELESTADAGEGEAAGEGAGGEAASDGDGGG